ncbi:putative ABC transporter permease protein YtcP [Spirochaetia bacterium]|nr:putative ABC transporter permease protein YtcP [Spirochaetia bacterium]
MIKNKSFSSVLVDVIIYVVLTLFALITLIPFYSILVGSLASARENALHPLLLWPREPTLDSYRYILSTATMPRALLTTIYITIVGTAVNIAMSVLMAWPLAHKRIMGRHALMFFVTFTLLFNGGMIPNYFIVRGTGLMNSWAALIIPSAINAFNLILMKNFFQEIPASLEESAKLDGANDLGILIRIVIPLSMPSIATFTLFYAVAHWNSFMNVLLYINDSTKWTIQVLLRQIVILSQGGVGDSSTLGDSFVIPPQGVKMAAIMFSTFPILCVYPFLQKYFIKGVMAGSIKG